MQQFGVRGPRRLIGRIIAALAGVAVVVGLVLSVGNTTFMSQTLAATGEIVAADPALNDQGTAIEDRWVVVIEYPDRNGQFRRFDEVIRSDPPPERGDEIAVRYRPSPPIEARIDNPWGLWRDVTLCGGIAIGLGVVAEELLRNRRRLRYAPSR